MSQDKDQRPVSHSVANRDTQDAAVEYKVVSVRLRAAEYDQFVHAVSILGLTSSMALRIAVRRISGFLEVDGELRRDLEKLLEQIGVLSRGVRDLHAVGMAGGAITIEQIEGQCSLFGEAFAQLDGMLRSILNVSHRRADGRALLTAVPVI